MPDDRFDPWIELDPAALQHNVRQVTQLSGGRPIRAVLKNNAYGLGLIPVARLLEPMHAIDGFAVVRTDEALALRQAGIRKPILLMARAANAGPGRTGRKRDRARGLRRRRSLSHPSNHWRSHTGRCAVLRRYGLSRMGVPHERALTLLRATHASPPIRITGMFTTVTEDVDFDREQLRRFHALVEAAKREGITTGRLHAASSNGVYHVEDAHLDLVRPGIALYGAYPSRPDEGTCEGSASSSMQIEGANRQIAAIGRG
ncbi:MAG: alanine racemase [Longimicrobiales bacterium]